MHIKKVSFLLALLCFNISFGRTTQNPSQGKNNVEDDSNPLLDMASMFIQEAFNNQNSQNSGSGGSAGAGLAGVASLLGTLMQDNQGKAAGSGAMQIISSIGSLIANANAGKDNTQGGGFDTSIISNMIEMFAGNDDSNEGSSGKGSTRGKRDTDSGINLESIMQIASAFISNNQRSSKRSINDVEYSSNDVETEDNGLLQLWPLAMQAISSFAGPEGQNTQEKHKDHAWVLPPFLEHIHVLWDHFSHSELADALYEKSGVYKILKDFKGRDGKLNYDKLFESLNNQSFRRRWIKSAILYLADWTSYLANPEVYLKYFQTAQLMFNGFLKTQGYPKTTFFDPSRPSETISNLLDYVATHHLNVKIHSGQYVKLAVGYSRELLKLGQARGLLQFNSTEISDKLTDTLNLEVIEPVLKVHRAYRFILKSPHCDRYVLCQLNSVEPIGQKKSGGLISGVSPNIVKVGSMGAAFFISTETGTPFWTLFGAISSPHNCDVKYPVDCSGFHEGEAKVTTEYIHNEL